MTFNIASVCSAAAMAAAGVMTTQPLRAGTPVTLVAVAPAGMHNIAHERDRGTSHPGRGRCVMATLSIDVVD